MKFSEYLKPISKVEGLSQEDGSDWWKGASLANEESDRVREIV